MQEKVETPIQPGVFYTGKPTTVHSQSTCYVPLISPFLRIAHDHTAHVEETAELC